MNSRTEAHRADLLSIVTTLYRSEGTIVEFVRLSLEAAELVHMPCEIVIVDDGSPDRSAELTRALADYDERIVLVQLSRNFGHHRAMLTGLEQSSGDIVFLIDSDLEEQPSYLPALLEKLRSESADCVYGVQRARKGSWFERASGNLFYRMFNALSEVRMPPNVSTMRVMTRRYVQSLLRFRDQNPVFVPLSLTVGYKQVGFSFDKRNDSPTTYSIWRRLSLLILTVTSFSGRPLSVLFAASMLFAMVGFLFGLFVVLRGLSSTAENGWPSLMAAIVFFFSLNALFTGVIGIYIKRLLEEVKDRPRTIIQEIYRKPAGTLALNTTGGLGVKHSE